MKVQCLRTNQTYLVDSGASVSIIQKTKNDIEDQQCNLKAANGTQVRTYGSQTIKISLEKNLSFWHTFVKADVEQPIIGADFLANNGLTVNMEKMILTHEKSRIKIKGYAEKTNIHSIMPMHCTIAQKLLDKYPRLQRQPDEPVASDPHAPKLEIITEGRLPTLRARHLNPMMRKKTKEHLESLLKRGIIKESKSPYSSPLHIVPKGDSYRFTVDFRQLNKVTKFNSYKLPYIGDAISELAGMKVFSKVDLVEAFHQVDVAPEDIDKTGTITPLGSFVWLKMPFGLKNAAQTFQCFIDQALRGLTRENEDGTQEKVTFFVYLDDILIASPDEEKHEKDLDAVFKRLSEKNLSINIKKCKFFQQEMEFLGFNLTTKGISPTEAKIKAVKEYKKPLTLGALKGFLGQINFCHKFIPNAAGIMAPLNRLLRGYTKKDRPKKIDWSDQEIQEAFEKSKKALADATMLAFPKHNAEIALFCDASKNSVGAFLAQKTENSTYEPLGFFSKELSAREKQVSTFQKELMAIYKALKFFQTSVQGYEFKIFTDNKSIPSALNKQNPTHNMMEQRMLSYISNYAVPVIHISGEKNFIADYLSRPELQVQENTNQEVDDTLQTGPTDGTCSAADTIGNKEPAQCNIIMETCSISQKELEEQQKICPEVQRLWKKNDTSLKLKIIEGIICDTSQTRARPLVPISLRKKIFHSLHDIAHPGGKRSINLVTERYVWPRCKQEIKKLTKCCIECQKHKIGRYNKPNTDPINLPSDKFSHISMDIVGPLYISNGYAYLLTIMDRFTSFFQCIPMKTATAKSVLDAYMLQWVAMFGVPEYILLDRGSVFKSNIFREAMETLGTKLNFTNAYKASTNGKIERFHRILKASIKTTLINGDPATWTERLALCMLGLRNCINNATNTTPAIMMFGAPTRLPGEIIMPTQDRITDTSTYAAKLKIAMANISPANPTFKAKLGYREPLLNECQFVFVREMHKKHGLSNNYKGPFKVIKKHDKYFEIDFGAKSDTVALHRIKVAHLMPEEDKTSIPKTRGSLASNLNEQMAVRRDNAGLTIDDLPRRHAETRRVEIADIETQPSLQMDSENINSENVPEIIYSEQNNTETIPEPREEEITSFKKLISQSIQQPPEQTGTNQTGAKQKNRSNILWTPNQQNLRASFANKTIDKITNNEPNKKSNSKILARLKNFNRPGRLE